MVSVREPRSPLKRTAIVSDIHGNVVALRAVIAELDADAIDRAVCLGDVCQGGPKPGECVDLLAERGWPVVLGNADAFVLDPATAEGSSEVVTDRQLTIRGWTYDRLTPAQRGLRADRRARSRRRLDAPRVPRDASLVRADRLPGRSEPLRVSCRLFGLSLGLLA